MCESECMLKRLFLQGLILGFAVFGFAQTTYHFEGNIKNSATEPLIGVQFVHPNTLKIIFISDESGSFNFNTNSKTIILQQIGYAQQVILPTDRSIIMKEESNLLNAIVVSENKRATQLKKATISMSIIQPELIENTSPTNISESIDRMNAVQVVDNQPTIRGGSGWSYGAGSRVGVLVDGVPMLSGDASQPLWNFIPTEGVAGIEIIKGASSVIYGSSALNGIIHIKTRKPSKTAYTRASISSGFYDLPKRKSLRYQGNKRNTISNITAYHSKIYNGIGVSIGLNLLDDNSYKMSDYDQRGRIHLGLRKTVSKHNIIYGINSSYQQGKSGSFLLWESLELGYTILDSIPTKSITSRMSIDPFLKWQSKRFSHALNTRYLHIDNDVESGEDSIDQSNGSTLLYATYQTHFSPLNSNLNVVAGLVSSSTISNSPLFSGNHTSKNFASYIQVDYPWKKLSASGGARYEYFTLDNRNEGRPVFRAGLNYEARKFTFFRASYGQGYRFPSIAESYIKTRVGPVSVFPNENIVSESGNNIEIGLRQGFKIRQLNLFLDLAAFQMNYENMMEFTFGQWGAIVPPTFGIGFKTLNTGRTSVKGLEGNVLFEGKFDQLTIQGFIGYTHAVSRALEPTKFISKDVTYRNTSSDTTNDILKYRPRHLAKSDIMINYKNWQIGMGATYQSTVENIDGAFALLVAGVQESIDQNLSEYLTLNVRCGYHLSPNWNANVIVQNISNREYAIRPADIAAPRQVRFQVTYTLDKSK